MLCKICGSPMDMTSDEGFAVYCCSSCGEERFCCTVCGTELVTRTEGMCIGMYCEQCEEYACVTSNVGHYPTREEVLQSDRDRITAHCLTYEDVYADHPFHDQNWCVIRHKRNNKIFAWIFERKDNIWINLKCDPQWTSFWRSAFASVIPAYHLNKTHWNSVILDGSVPDADVYRMVKESYGLTKP